MTKSEQLFERAVKRIPGGVNSPVRSYGAIGEAPRFIEKQINVTSMMWMETAMWITLIPGAR